MKKKLFIAMAVVVTIAFSGFNIYQSQNTEKLANLTMNNVEALAAGESTTGYKYVHYPDDGDEGAEATKCTCTGKGSLDCCD